MIRSAVYALGYALFGSGGQFEHLRALGDVDVLVYIDARGVPRAVPFDGSFWPVLCSPVAVYRLRAGVPLSVDDIVDLSSLTDYKRHDRVRSFQIIGGP